MLLPGITCFFPFFVRLCRLACFICLPVCLMSVCVACLLSCSLVNSSRSHSSSTPAVAGCRRCKLSTIVCRSSGDALNPRPACFFVLHGDHSPRVMSIVPVPTVWQGGLGGLFDSSEGCLPQELGRVQLVQVGGKKAEGRRDIRTTYVAP